MPKPCTVPWEELISLFLEQKGQIVSETGNISPPTAPVWDEISRTLEYKVSKKYLYTFVKCNRHAVWLTLGIQKDSNEIQDISELENNDFTKVKPSNELDFTITLSPDEWEKIGPQEKNYKCKDVSNPDRNYRQYSVLMPGWTDTINEHFWEHTRLSCSLAFKRAKITQEGKFFCTMFGSCTECKSSFLGYLENEPTSKSRVLIKCTYTGEYTVKHSGLSKRYLTGTSRQNAIDCLTKMNVSSSMYQKIMANEKMRFGDVEPSHIPSTNALRLAKSRALDIERLDSDPTLAILKSKYTQPFQETIKDIGLDKFFVHYWSPSQLHVYRAYHEQNKISKISVDATGSIVKCLRRPYGNTSGHIFLYEATVHDSPSRLQYSVCNMISERQDNNSIYHWLAQWLRDGALIPKEAVCDFSLALLSALVRAFTRYNTLEAYLGECSKILCNPEKFSPPECFVRCDVAHAVKLIASWPPMRDQKNYRVRNLYIRSMAQVIQATSIDDVKSLLTSIITVALSPFEGVDKITGEATRCETAKEKLKRRIATGFSDMEDNLSRAIDIEKSGIASEDLGNLNTESSRNEEVGHNSFQSWAESIVDTCKKSIVTLDGDHDNLQYLPDLVPCIVKLCRLLPMWSALLVPFFGYGGNTASSAPVESSFNDLKNRVLSHKKLPMRADDFLETHINSLEGTMKLIAAKSVQNPYSDETHEKESVLVSSQEENINDFPRNSESSEKTRGENYGDIPETEFSVQGNNVNKKIGEANRKKSHVPNLHITSCPACIDGNFPTGAHRCIKCKIPVHIFPECSVSISSSEEGKEEEEGYGQGRTCRKCSTRSTNTMKMKELHTRTEGV